MSETLTSQPLEPVYQQPLEANQGVSIDFADPMSTPGEFSYRPVPIAAPVSLFLGFCSIVGLFVVEGLAVALFGALLGAICWYRIRQSKGELGGKWIALTGSIMSFVLLGSGAALFAYNFKTEVPPGYERVNFTRDISKKGFVVEKGKRAIHPDVAAMEGREIFIKGYMYPDKTPHNLTSFLLVKDNEVCCYGGQPGLNDMIMVKFKDGAKVNHHSGLVSVGGIFHAASTPSPAGYDAVYTLDATHFERAKTSY